MERMPVNDPMSDLIRCITPTPVEGLFADGTDSLDASFKLDAACDTYAAAHAEERATAYLCTPGKRTDALKDWLDSEEGLGASFVLVQQRNFEAFGQRAFNGVCKLLREQAKDDLADEYYAQHTPQKLTRSP